MLQLKAQINEKVENSTCIHYSKQLFNLVFIGKTLLHETCHESSLPSHNSQGSEEWDGVGKLVKAPATHSRPLRAFQNPGASRGGIQLEVRAWITGHHFSAFSPRPWPTVASQSIVQSINIKRPTTIKCTDLWTRDMRTQTQKMNEGAAVTAQRHQ